MVMRSSRRFGGVVLTVFLGAFAGCGGGGSTEAPAPPDAAPDTAVYVPMEAGVPEAEASSGPIYPASHPAIPQVVSGGTVMTAPKIVNVSFQSDPLESDIDTFAAAMATTTYWGDRTMEYGIAPLMPIARIHDTTANWPATVDDSAIQTWLASQLDGSNAAWPAVDENTIYALYFPPGVSITATSSGLPASCGTSTQPSWHGYHSETQLASGKTAIYAVISRCDSLPEDPSATGIQYVSAVASHEIIEGITDPFVLTGPLGYSQTDPDHIAFAYASLAELGDMCAVVGNAFYTPPDFAYLVQRIWSNKVAPSGHDPCLPEPAGQVYFNSAPVLNDTVHYPGGTTKGVNIPAGQTKTIEVDLFSEGPTPGPWSVEAFEMDGGDSLTFSFDKSSGQNGDKLHLSIQVKSGTNAGAEIFGIVSRLGTQLSVWVGMVGN
jgi:hypothetical protein